MLEKLLAESKALRESDLVVADRRRLAIMVKEEEDVWLPSWLCAAAVLMGFFVEVAQTGVARSRRESSRVEMNTICYLLVFSFLANQQLLHRSEVEGSYFINYHHTPR